MGNGDFRPPGAPEPLNRSSWNLAQLITLGIQPHKQKLVYASLRVYGGGRGENITSVAFFIYLFFSSFFTYTEYPAELGLTLNETQNVVRW